MFFGKPHDSPGGLAGTPRYDTCTLMLSSLVSLGQRLLIPDVRHGQLSSMLQLVIYYPVILYHATFRPERKNQRLAEELTRRYRTLYCDYLLVGGSGIGYTAREKNCGIILEDQANWSFRAAIMYWVTLVLLPACSPDPEWISRVKERHTWRLFYISCSS